MLKDLLDTLECYASKLKSDEFGDEVIYSVKATGTQGFLPKTPISVELAVIGKSKSGLPIPEAGAITYAGGTKIVYDIAEYAKTMFKFCNAKVIVNGHRILLELPADLNE